jgi:hypothetical protein
MFDERSGPRFADALPRSCARKVEREWRELLARNDAGEALHVAQRSLHANYFEDGTVALEWLRAHYQSLTPLWLKIGTSETRDEV